MTQWSCSKCSISYYEQKQVKPRCPLCDAEAQVLALRQLANTQQNLLDRQEEALSRLQTHVDLMSAMREAIAVMSVEDTAFLKSVLYRYRNDKARVNIKPTHGPGPKGPANKRGQPPVNGFVAQIKGEVETHLCNSPGGMAVAGYLAEAINTVGQPNTMSLLLKAFAETLNGTS